MNSRLALAGQKYAGVDIEPMPRAGKLPDPQPAPEPSCFLLTLASTTQLTRIPGCTLGTVTGQTAPMSVTVRARQKNPTRDRWLRQVTPQQLLGFVGR